MKGASRATCRVRLEPSGLKTEVPRGGTLLEAARLAGVYLTSLCGGDGICGKCKVVVAEGEVDAPETTLLTDEEVRQHFVLACQARVLSDVTVAVPGGHALDTGRILVGVDTRGEPCAGVAGTFPFDPPLPPLDDPARRHYGVAVDVGTTTVVAHLLDYAARETVDAEAAYNSQMHFGEDYIRRIMYAEEHGALKEMQQRIVGDINGLIDALTARHKVARGDVALVVCTGNTAMIHFLFGREAGWIRRGLARPDALALGPCPAADLGIRIYPEGLLYALPAVGAYVGADIVAGVLATRMDEEARMALLVDIGTNGEIVLGGKEWMACASSSAGPAFEGSGIRHGMRATAGAIERVSVAPDGSIRYKTIGGSLPRGLCGSGLLGLLATFADAGIIDRSGRFARADDPRLAEGADGPEFTLVPATEGRSAIVITQADITNLIRSKAGVYAAIQALLESTGTRPDQLAVIYVAGGFGNYLDPVKAIRIGMLPDVPVDRIAFVGNTSIAGAKMAAMSRAAMAQAAEIAGRMTYVDLMTHPGYMDAFIQANFLPHTNLALFPSVRGGRGADRAAGAEGKGR